MRNERVYTGCIYSQHDRLVTVERSGWTSALSVPKDIDYFSWGNWGPRAEALAWEILRDALPQRMQAPGLRLQRLARAFLDAYVARWIGSRSFSVTSTEIVNWATAELAKRSHTSDVGGHSRTRQRPSSESSLSPASGTGKSTAVEEEGGRKEARH